MRLLVTNDDGIDSVFLHELVFALQRAGHHTQVAAPKSEQSWIGAAKTRLRPVRAVTQDCGLGCPTWSIDGTPSDCVSIALAHHVGGEIDAVVSGINIGLNASVGFILASGTVAGAWEGAVHGLPAIAFSQDIPTEEYHRLKEHGGVPDESLRETLRHSAEHAARGVADLIAATPRRSFTVHNINFPYPCARATEWRRTIPAHVIIPGLFGPAEDDGTHRFVFRLGDDVSQESAYTDRRALLDGKISHTVLDYRRLGAH